MWKSTLIKPFAKHLSSRIEKRARNAVSDQYKLLYKLVETAAGTAFGKEHDFSAIKSHREFAQRVPIRDYEGLKPWITRSIEGEEDVLWPGRPRYLAKTSGTTSGVKYIPITRQSIPNHFGTARNALFHYADQSGNFSFIDGKMIFLSGSPELEDKNGIPLGRLSGIVNHFVPSWLRANQMPSYVTNCIEDWEEKLERIVDETVEEDMRLISGIPPWVQMYYERLIERTGKSTVKEIFPNLSVFVYGGVNYEPYRESLSRLMGADIDSIETYPASEGFIAFQDKVENEGLLLNTHSGIFFEFVPSDEIFNADPARLSLEEVEKGKNYVPVINSNAGLWGYNLGDTIEFVSTEPYRLRVTGRVKHFISAFGEHVIAKEVEEALQQATQQHPCSIVEFTVAPQVNPPEGNTPYHEWFIEFGQPPADLDAFARSLDQIMQKENIYYKDLRDGQILRRAVVRPLPQNAFRELMKSLGKLGGQSKVPRLSNDRNLVEGFHRKI